MTARDQPLIVWHAGVDWDAVVGTDRQLATSIADLGVQVLWVDPPQSIARMPRSRGLRGLIPHTAQPHNSVSRLTIPAPPYPQRLLVEPLTRVLIDRAVSRELARRGSSPAATVVTSPHPRFARRGTGTRVYYATDDFTAGAALMGESGARLGEMERRRVADADLVGAVSSQIVARWAARETFVLANGCDVDAYRDVEGAAVPADVALQHPIAGLVGQLSARIDISLLEAVADRGVSLLLVGPRQQGWEPSRFERLSARSNVVWVGAKEYSELPSYLRLIDVGLTPYADTPFNRGSFPLKTLEYLAAGRAVVSTPLPAVDALGTDLILVAAGADGFADAVVRLCGAHRTDQAVRLRREFAHRHSWAARARQLLDMIGIETQS